MKPIPPCTCSDDEHTRQPASEAYAFAIEQASSSVSGWASAVQAP